MQIGDETLVKFSRDGRQYSEYKFSLVLEAMRLGRVLESDYYWHAGMTDWKKVADAFQQPTKQPIPSSPVFAPNSTNQQDDFAFIVSTTFSLEGYRIVHYLRIVRGLIVRSPNIAEGINGWGEGLLGGKQNVYTGMCEKTRSEAYEEMIKNAKAMGANAVVGVAYDTTEIMAKCTEVLCYGTAVIIERIR